MEEASERSVPGTTEGAELGWPEWPRERGPARGGAVGAGGEQSKAGQWAVRTPPQSAGLKASSAACPGSSGDGRRAPSSGDDCSLPPPPPSAGL